MKKILVVGAGPVGLTLAAELARHGVTCQIVEKLMTRSIYCKAIGVTPRTLEIWEDQGIARKAIEAGVWLKGRQVDISGRPGEIVMTDNTDLPYSSLSLPQYETERILTEHLNNFGVFIRRGISIIEIKTKEDTVDVTFSNTDGAISTESFDYVIGCDGAHSSVRRLSGIDFQGEMMPYEFMLADVKISWDMPRGVVYNAVHPATDTAPDFFLAIPLPDSNRYRISTLLNSQIKADDQGNDHGIQSERPAPDLAIFQEIADRLSTKKAILSDVRWASIFRISMRLATSYRKGNIFIAGDAAHIHPPTGGQGMNTGIQDAYNLAWKLALVCKGIAKDKLLDSYEAERQEEGLNVINRTVAASMNFGKDGLKSDRLTDAQMHVSYRNSPIILKSSSINNDEFLQAGDRAPDCMEQRCYGFGFPIRLFEIFKGTHHTMLIDAGDQPNDVLKELNSLSDLLKNRFGEEWTSYFKVVIISSEQESVSPDSGVLLVQYAGKEFTSKYDSQKGSGFIIRPDGYIGWRGTDWKNSELETYLKTIF